MQRDVGTAIGRNGLPALILDKRKLQRALSII